jgi:hypothetical protein
MPDFNPKDRTIRVIVQANKLFNTDLTEDDVDKYTSLEEDGGLTSAFGNPNRDFETIVYMSKRICWSIELNDPSGEDTNYSVSLSSVDHNPDDGNPNFFTQDSLTVNPGTGQVCGTIARNPNLPNKDDSYTIEFNIVYSTQDPPLSTIKAVFLDPKLKISTRN